MSGGDAPRIALLVARFNSMVTEQLLEGTRHHLLEEGIPESRLTVFRVPGSWELPQAAQRIALSGEHDAIIAIGCVIRGETAHFDLVANQASDGLGRVALAADIPVIFGVLATDTPEQAMARAEEGPAGRGAEFARAALDMLAFRRSL